MRISRQMMVQWMAKNVSHEVLQGIHDRLHHDGGNCSNLHFFAYSMGEMNKASQDVNEAIMRFINARLAMEKAADALNDDLDEGLNLPAPPVQIAEMEDGSVNIGVARPHPKQEKPNHDFSITVPMGRGGKYSLN